MARRKKAEAAATQQQELPFNSDDWNGFLHEYSAHLSDLHVAQRACGEAKKGVVDKGCDPMARDFILKLKAKVDNDKLSARDALAVLDSAMTLGEWTFGEDAAQEQRGFEADAAA